MGDQKPNLRCLLAALAALAGGCAAQDPESAIEQLIDDAELAAEARETGHFRGLIAASYADTRGNNRDGLIDLIRGYFFTHPTIDVFTRIDSVELRGEDAAEVVVLAGVLGRRPGEGLLEGFDGRLYRLELELVAIDGDWQIIGADWERSLEALRGD